MLAVVDVVAGGERERYSLPLGAQPWPALVGVVEQGRSVAGLTGSFAPGTARGLVGGAGSRPLSDDQTNTSVVLDERLVAKLYRRLEAGAHPEVEAVSALELPEVPAYRGSLSYRDQAGRESTLLLLQDYVPAAESGWDAYIERLVAACAEPAGLEQALADVASFAETARRLHHALAEALPVATATPDTLAARRRAAEARLDEAGEHLPAGTAARLRADLAGFDDGAGAPLQRLHGDLTVAQYLRRPDGGLSVIDFEGEPGRPLAERTAPWTTAWDVATLLLSFENAGAAARRRIRARGLSEDTLDAWLAEAPARAVAGYGDPPPEPLLRASLAEKQVTELLYAARRLPEWLYAPLEVLGRRWG